MTSAPTRLPFADSTVLVDRTGVRLTNRIGGEMLALHAAAETPAGIARRIAARYEVPEARVRADVERFFAGLDALPAMVFGSVGPRPRPVAGPEPDDDRLEHRARVALPPYHVTVHAADAALLRRFAAVTWPPADAPARATLRVGLHRRGTGYPIAVDGRWVDRADTPAGAVFLALRHLAAAFAVAEPFTALLHAGALERDGHALILAGPSGVGKSTLVAGCVAHGWRLVNDDTVAVRVVRRAAEVSSPALPIGVKPGSVATLRPLWPALERLEPEPGGVPPMLLRLPRERLCPGPVPCRLLVLPRFVAHARRATVETVEPETALAELCRAGVFLGDPPDVERLRAWLDWLEAVSVRRLSYPSLDAARARLDELV